MKKTIKFTFAIFTAFTMLAALVLPYHGAEAQSFTPPVFINEWSGPSESIGLAVHPTTGDVYVADLSNGKIERFDKDGTPLGTFLTTSPKAPKALAIDPAGGFIYVGYDNSTMIEKYNFSTTPALAAGWDINYTGSAHYNSTSGIAVDNTHVYISPELGGIENQTSEIIKYDTDGNFVLVWGFGVLDGSTNALQVCPPPSTSCFIGIDGDSPGGQLYYPRGLEVMSGHVYVADGNNRIVKYTTSGGFVTEWATGPEDSLFDFEQTGSTNDIGLPTDVAIDSSGNIHVAHTVLESALTSPIAASVKVFNDTGTLLLGTYGSLGTLTGQFLFPASIGISSADDSYVLDFALGKVLKFGPPACGDFLLKWGSSGSGDGQFILIREIALDSSGNVYVGDTDLERVQKFDSSGGFITEWGSLGSGDGQFNQLYGIAIDSFDNVYTTESSNHRVQKFDSSGGFDIKWGSFGSGDGQLSTPLGNTVDSSGNVYVADFGNHRISKFTSSGTFLGWWGRDDLGGSGFHAPGSGRVGASGAGDGEFYRPYAIAVDSSDNTYVVDANNRVQKFDSSGTFITKWGSFSFPLGIAVDSSDYVYVASSHRVQKFNSSGTFIAEWGSLGSGDGQFHTPLGIVIDPSGNDVYVTDVGNKRVQKFACPLLPPVVDTDGDGVLDDVDACVNTPGPVERQGCPIGNVLSLTLRDV